MTRQLIYRPTREPVRLLGIANEGQYRPGDPGSGMRLYAVEAIEPRVHSLKQFQADAGELYVREQNRRISAFKEEDWVHDPAQYEDIARVIRQEYEQSDPGFDEAAFQAACLGHTLEVKS